MEESSEKRNSGWGKYAAGAVMGAIIYGHITNGAWDRHVRQYESDTIPVSVTVKDINNDGRPDMIVKNNIDTYFFINNGDGTYSKLEDDVSRKE